VAKALLVTDQAVGQIRLILPRLVQQRVTADDAAVYLIQPHLAPELDGLTRLVPLNHLGVRLKEAQ